MTLVATGTLVSGAAAEHGAVAALNVITLEHGEAVVAAAEQVGVPVVLQLSENAIRYHGRAEPVAAACVALAESASTPVGLHLDHATDPALVRTAADCGFGSVMIDAGALPYGRNVEVTRAAADEAHRLALWIEAELGYVGGKPDAPKSAHAAGVRTDPAEARAFAADTGVDALAVAVGSTHAMTSRSARLDTDLIVALRETVPVPLVLHGSSGVPDDELRRGIRAGLAKINVGTALNVALTQAVRAALAEQPELVDPRRYLAAGRSAMTDSVAALLRVISRP